MDKDLSSRELPLRGEPRFMSEEEDAVCECEVRNSSVCGRDEHARALKERCKGLRLDACELDACLHATHPSCIVT